MDEVEAVTTAIRNSMERGWCTWDDVARAAIAALDACRSYPQMEELLNTTHARAYRAGREAGLREAAAFAQGFTSAKHIAFDMASGAFPLQTPMPYAIAAGILALIDAGETPGPSQPEPGAALSPGHEGA